MARQYKAINAGEIPNGCHAACICGGPFWLNASMGNYAKPTSIWDSKPRSLRGLDFMLYCIAKLRGILTTRTLMTIIILDWVLASLTVCKLLCLNLFFGNIWWAVF